MPKLQRAKTVACGLLRWDRCCIIVVSHWSKPAGQNMASLLVVVGFRTSHSMPKEESHVIFSKNLPLKGTPGPPVNVDGHNMKTDSRQAMQHAFLTQEDRYGKASRPFSPQDQASKTPRIALAAYSGTPVSQVTRRRAGLTRDSCGRDFLLVAAKAWYGGQLIQDLHTPSGGAGLTPVKSSPTRLVEFDAVPFAQY